jgi:CSLREA domain-containing protein
MLEASTRPIDDSRFRRARLAVLLVAAALLPAAPSAAATIVVDSFADELAADLVCTLREAVIAANTNVAVGGCDAGSSHETDSILLAAGTYALTIAGSGEDEALTGDLDLLGSVQINGAGSGLTVIDAGGRDRIFHVLDGSKAQTDVFLTSMTLKRGGVDGGSGGCLAIDDQGSGSLVVNLFALHFERCFVGESGAGAALHADLSGGSFMRFSKSMMRSSEGRGVVHIVADGADFPMSLQQLSLVENDAEGGPVIELASGDATLENVTVVENGDAASALRVGNGDAVLYNVTMVRNRLAGGAATPDLDLDTGLVSIYGSIVGGCVEGAAATGVQTEWTLRLDWTGSCTVLGGGLTDLVVPSVGAMRLATSPGPHRSVLWGLLPTLASPAVDAVNDGSFVCLPTDLDEKQRPQDDDRDGIARCTLGALEGAAIFTDGFESGDLSAWGP